METGRRSKDFNLDERGIETRGNGGTRRWGEAETYSGDIPAFHLLRYTIPSSFITSVIHLHHRADTFLRRRYEVDSAEIRLYSRRIYKGVQRSGKWEGMKEGKGTLEKQDDRRYD